MSHYETLTFDAADGVATLTLNRPQAANGFNEPMMRELALVAARCDDDPTLKAVILTGAGKFFSAGGDLKGMAEAGDARGAYVKRLAHHLHRAIATFASMDLPLIVAVNGMAAGGGFSLALASDIRITGESAKMNAAYIKIGLTGCDMGSSYFLPRLVGTSVAAELMLTGRFIHAERALATGLVSEVVAQDKLGDAVKPYLKEMLTTSPMGLRLTKEGLNMAIDANSLESAMAIENRNQILCSQTQDAKEGMTAFLEKRDPVYTGR